MKVGNQVSGNKEQEYYDWFGLITAARNITVHNVIKFPGFKEGREK